MALMTVQILCSLCPRRLTISETKRTGETNDVEYRKEAATLRRMKVGQLQSKFSQVFGEPTNARNKEWLVKRILWRLQAIRKRTAAKLVFWGHRACKLSLEGSPAVAVRGT